MKSETKNRNKFVDMMRGIAMLMVVLGHTMTGCTSNAQDSFLFNVVWSLQMPLFILISGYITKYSHKIVDWPDFFRYLYRRTVAYMLPWAIWSFIIRGFIFGEHNFFDIRYILWNMDSGYWFLATIWTISIVFGVASYIAKCVVKEDGIKQQFVVLAVYICGMFALFGTGLVFGLSFFAIKLTLYYMPFYLAGYLFGQYDDRLLSSPIGRKFADCMIGLCAVWWIYILLRYSLYDLNDSGWNIILRASTSLAGCITICGLLQEMNLKGKFLSPPHTTSYLRWKEFTGNLPHALSDVGSGESCIYADSKLCHGDYSGVDELSSYVDAFYFSNSNDGMQSCFEENSIWKIKLVAVLGWFGRNSLQVYLTHGLLLNILNLEHDVIFESVAGYALVLSNFILTILLCYLILQLLACNSVLRRILSVK